jgi:putative redox protein
MTPEPVSEVKPPVTAELIWSENLIFNATSAKVGLTIDGGSTAGPSPVQLLVISLAGCMAMDVVDIVRKGRHPLTAFTCRITGERAPDHPRRLVKVALHFHLSGTATEAAVQRAIDLSRDKYCSVWGSLRQDIELSTSFDITP